MNRLAPAVLLLPLAIAIVACGANTSADATAPEATATTTTTPAADPADYFASLCAVLADARGGDLDAAAVGFDHGPLHALAENVEQIDRAASASLLRAKEAVESTFDDAAPDAIAAVQRIVVLTEATRVAYRVSGQADLEPCEER